MSNIVRYENNISAEDFINKKTETKDKWNQINLLSMEYVLGVNCRMPLIHMSNIKIWIEEKNQRINEFSFAHMLNPILNKNKAFKDQVKACLSNTFGADTNKLINKTYLSIIVYITQLITLNIFLGLIFPSS